MRRIGSLAAAKPPTNGIEKHRLSGLPSLNYQILKKKSIDFPTLFFRKIVPPAPPHHSPSSST